MGHQPASKTTSAFPDCYADGVLLRSTELEDELELDGLRGAGTGGSSRCSCVSRCSADVALVAHHLPTCAPPSTCSTSPVTVFASVRYKTASTISCISESTPMGDRV